MEKLQIEMSLIRQQLLCIKTIPTPTPTPTIPKKQKQLQLHVNDQISAPPLQRSKGGGGERSRGK